jgi:hypothetical protein
VVHSGALPGPIDPRQTITKEREIESGHHRARFCLTSNFFFIGSDSMLPLVVQAIEESKSNALPGAEHGHLHDHIHRSAKAASFR